MQVFSRIKQSLIWIVEPFQILELGRWRSVCTNSRNWTQADMEVACRQLGFTGGEWYFWYLHLNDTVQMLYEEPGDLKC